MRRPVKPFVTEYRGNTRRQSGSNGQATGAELEPLPRPTEPRQTETSRYVAAQQEDSYEAALRAADALFSASPSSTQRKPAAPKSQIPNGGDTNIFSEVPEARLAAPNAKPGGRVLRVLDEPPLPELTKLEAERAPKRRGRKPGSKNKPKATIADAAGEAPSRTSERLSRSRPQSAEIAPAPVAAILTAPGLVVADAIRAPGPRQLAASRPAVDAPRPEKYAWVRTKLKPGERWKRRLPKIAW